MKSTYFGFGINNTEFWLFAFYHSALFLSVKLLKAVLSLLDAEIHTALLAPVHRPLLAALQLAGAALASNKLRQVVAAIVPHEITDLATNRITVLGQGD